MTREEMFDEFDVVWDGAPEHLICVETDAQYVKRMRGLEQTFRGFGANPVPVKRSPPGVSARGQQRATVLAAVPPDRWASAWTIAQRCGLVGSSVVPSELYYLLKQGKVQRARPEGRWVYRRVA